MRLDTEYWNGVYIVMGVVKNYTLAWEGDDANILFIKMDWRAGNDEFGFRVLDSWTVGMCFGVVNIRINLQ